MEMGLELCRSEGSLQLFDHLSQDPSSDGLCPDCVEENEDRRGQSR